MDLEDYQRHVGEFPEGKIKCWLRTECRSGHGGVLDDLTQNVYEKLLRAKLEGALQIRNFDAYVRGVCQNVAIDWMRELKKRRRMDDGVKPLLDLSTERTPESLYIEIEDLERTAQAIQQLPRRQREVFELVHFKGWKVEQIARMTGRAVSTINSLLFDARRNVRKNRSNDPAGKARRKKRKE